MSTLDSIVIGAGQAGLSASFHLRRRGIEHVVLDADARAGGAWQHRWDALTMRDVHGVAELPGDSAPPRDERRANIAVPEYFAAYEKAHDLPVLRPVHVRRVHDDEGVLVVEADEGEWRTRTLVNATGTWTQPFIPHYPGMETFLGEQFHTVDYPGPEHFLGKRVLVVGGGASAVQFLGALAPLTETLWVTRRPPVWRDDDFTPEAGAAAVALVEKRVAAGLPPESVVSVTGLMLRPQEREAERLGAYADRRPLFQRIEPDGVRWSDGAFERVDVILWATGFRPAIGHLAPLHLRSAAGGIQLDRGGRGTTAVADPRVQLVGYGPSASTIGANRAGRPRAREGGRRGLLVTVSSSGASCGYAGRHAAHHPDRRLAAALRVARGVGGGRPVRCEPARVDPPLRER
ncbi:flavin-containing monooxygenase [Microbacterium paraoxydans]|uniref:Predicted flavoprotein CzcO associated with the cation diffusion facilitator CzcD n=1 Tax=Microbacterium paraoxydans TaxID=199592 RepID=A0A1H1MWV3_9MICO|nr:NAD(P)/FAD-dependent oxidoreductase [Microbacterium paraoxydans]SDR90945.1 Predicted flavoprotein CzcO associated with the cation diffusion facilitator CzcD [Microbacterium paraoxydans]